MSGHSKWANIKHKKARADAQKGQAFTKIGRELVVAARAGGPDPANNFRLKLVIEKAKAINIPNDNIQRAIQKGAGSGEGENYEELRYEGYAPGGVAVMVNILTDNRNRTAGEMRHIFSKNGGNLGETGCVSWMFKEKGQLSISREGLKTDEDEFLLLALDAGAEDVETEEESFQVYTDPADMESVRQALLDQSMAVEDAAVNLIPENKIEIADPDQASKIIKLIDALDEHDDVQGVFTNFELAEAIAAEFEE
ncbi:MAG: YebC/PmpR family DNA-binding transcriptional regulator [Desulfitobacteriaceae bacterium]|nr:YebC/PmpR family DNA-binding transcriptional regulator [Desulfitobacteriaceae bacterium]MDI6880325.1 YebC/PmpR family DNA-binding transcriptional regulator [Desulfitobacteriaceae bacterium]MDI6915680.1 YebC/PmpR family DNA-binding transcriptional regulator [Desulfitobacteriaceae bacterium]